MGSGPERSVLLCGMMGAGKSSVGRVLARELGRVFVDTDERVAARAGMAVPELFARFGEERFRALEREVLGGLPERRAVVALGGGALVAPENRALLREKGILVLLEARPETLAERIGDEEDRPLLRGTRGPARVARLEALLAERAQAYAAAALRIGTDGRTIEQVCAILRAALEAELAA